MTTWGNVQDFKYFLPQLFALLAQTPKDFTLPSALIGKLDYANWQLWPAPEQVAVADYLSALWSAVLTSDDPHLVHDILEGLEQVTNDLSPFLDICLSSDHPRARQNLAHVLLFAPPAQARVEPTRSRLLQYLRDGEAQLAVADYVDGRPLTAVFAVLNG